MFPVEFRGACGRVAVRGMLSGTQIVKRFALQLRGEGSIEGFAAGGDEGRATTARGGSFE